MMMAPAAFADEIGDAAKKLGIFLQAPGKFQPLEALKAIDKMIEMGAAADPKLLKAAAEAHHKAIGSISGPNGVTSRADWDAVNDKIGVAAKALSDASYPFLKEVHNDQHSMDPIGPPKESRQRVDLITIAKDDSLELPILLQFLQLIWDFVKSNHWSIPAIGSIDAKGVPSIGRIVASVPKATVMDVCNSMAAVVDGIVSCYREQWATGGRRAEKRRRAEGMSPGNLEEAVHRNSNSLKSKSRRRVMEIEQDHRLRLVGQILLDGGNQDALKQDVKEPVKDQDELALVEVLSVVAALVALYNFCNSWSFVPGPLRKHVPVAAASAAGMMMAPAAFADEIGDAAKKLGDASYDFAKEDERHSVEISIEETVDLAKV
ncbi:unnamed protein product [Durusdinium trenchii]|uniref:Uncharacterized protein n=1 Tax=Durusdinium trenchii TaxID=1381693 RepID=A0ABP0INX2_9DINO